MTEKPSTDPGLTTARTDHRGATRLKVTGYVDLSTAPLLERAVKASLDESPRLLIIDLMDVDFLGSGGLTILARAHDALTPEAELAVVANDIAARLLEITGLDQVFAVHRTLETVFGD
jgi:anti-anti-sigma factor